MPRLLTTQSHVVHGFVGNKAATFPLQCRGWDVDCINSVQFSNHTGYGMSNVFGNVTSEKDLEALYQGIEKFSPKNRRNYDALLSGYLPSASTAYAMGKYYQRLKDLYPQLLWLMDPVMGDDGQLYVDKDIVPVYRELAHSGKVDIITPNQFELELLCGFHIIDYQQLMDAVNSLHGHIPIIVVTSLSASIFGDSDSIYCLVSEKGSDTLCFKVPAIRSYFTGVGDLFSALLLDRLYSMRKYSEGTLTDAINHALEIVQGVLHTTRSICPVDVCAKMGSVEAMREMELKIIESRDIFEDNNSTICKTSYLVHPSI